VYGDGDDDEVTSVFVPGSDAALRLGESATLRSISSPPITPRLGAASSAPRGSVPAPLSPSVTPARSAVSARPPSSREQKTVPPARLSTPPVQVQPISSMPVPSYERYAQPRKSGAGRWVAVVAGFAVAAAVLFFLFVPRTGGLLVTVAGPGALPVKQLAVYVDGQQRCSQSPCTLTDLSAGSHLVRVQANGFEPTADQAIVVNAGSDAAHNFVLTPAAVPKAALEVSAGLAGVRVFVDETPRGLLPLSLRDLEPREYKLRFEAGERIEPLEQRVTLKPGETSKIEVSGWVLKRGKLTVSLPARFRMARVQLDGKTLRKFPATFELDAKEPHHLTASLRGYETLEHAIALTAEQPEQQITIELSRPGDKPREEAVSPAPSPAAPSGSRVGETEQAPAEKAEPVASRTPTAPADGHKSIFNTSIATPKESAPKESSVESAPASAAFGTLNINSIPSTTVIVNGKTMGRTPRMGLKVKPGTQSIVFIHPDKGKKQTMVEVPAGDTKTVAVRF
jgi:serine/threonine-protein kinase